MNYDGKIPPRVSLTETPAMVKIEDCLINAVLAGAAVEVDPNKGVWKKMIQALYAGADKTKSGTIREFLYQAMVDRLVEEFHALDAE